MGDRRPAESDLSRLKWLPYDGIYDIGDGWLMAPDKHRRDDHRIDRQLNQIDDEIDEDLDIDKDTLRQVALARRAVREDLNRMEGNIMGRLDSVDAALDNISTQLTQLSGQIADLTAGSVSQEEIDALAAKAQGIADAVDAAIEPDAGEGEPPPSPEEPV